MHLPRYFYHVRDGVSLPDTEGVELPGVSEARLHAVRLSGRLIEANAYEAWIDEEWWLEVTDADQLILFALNIQMKEYPAISTPTISPSPRSSSF